MTELTHFDDTGASRMVDVGAKPITQRWARAETYVTMCPETLRLIQNRKMAKGDVLEVARLAGIMGSKQTGCLVPLCHPLNLDSVQVDFEVVSDKTVRIEACVKTHGRTGVEMEALTAVSVAALTVYDMCKSVDRGMVLGPTSLIEKAGGKSGHYRREGPSSPETTVV